jgi:hypothetical protein
VPVLLNTESHIFIQPVAVVLWASYVKVIGVVVVGVAQVTIFVPLAPIGFDTMGFWMTPSVGFNFILQIGRATGNGLVNVYVTLQQLLSKLVLTI